MIRRHSTRLSQAHDEEPDEGQRTAARDYPELGGILDDRPDPGGVITVIGMRRQADAYGTPQDARNDDYNGGEGDTGMYWAEPGQQAWRDEHLGPQEEAPPPLFDPEMNPVMARLAAIEEAQGFFGARHHATTINGTQVDDAGDAPQHGTIPRAEEPNSYDDESREGTGDPKWDDALPWGDKKNENGATVGMYPEGIEAGGGPGISVGPVTAAVDLARHMQEDHNFPHQYPGMTGDQLRMLGEDHAALHEYGGTGHDHGDEDANPYWDVSGDASGQHFASLTREARVPWTGKERGTLHRWQENPEGATWGDFVPSSEFPLLDPGEHVHHEEPGEGLARVEATSDSQWEAHLRHGHGWDDARIEQARQQGGFRRIHDAVHTFGLASHRHAGGPEAAREEARDTALNNMFGPQAPRRKLTDWTLARPEVGGSGREDPETALLHSQEAREPRHPDEYYESDPARFRRMMSALNVHVRIDGKELPQHEHDEEHEDPGAPPHEHDDAVNSLDSDPDSGPDKNGPEIKSPQFSPGAPPDSKADRAPVNPMDPDDPMNDPGNWPQTGADVSERDRAYTQGSGDGQVQRGAPAPTPFSPGDGDSGGGGDQGDDAGDQPDDEDTPFSKDAALEVLAGAARHWRTGAGERAWRATLERASTALLRAGEDPGTVGALRLLAGLRATADQASAPWGSQNVSQSPPVKTYGATSAPNKDQDPGSYGFLAGPDPENWGGIQEDSVYQMPLSNTAAHQVLVPGAPHPVPGDLHWPSVNGWQAEDQGTFGYTDRASTAGPSTAMSPRDPDGIRMEEARRATAAGTPFPYHGEAPQLDGALAELHGEPEAALPSTTGDDEIEATAAADGTIGGGDAGTGQGQGAAADAAFLGEFGASAMGDLARETWPQAQQPSPVGQEPGMGSGDDALSPDDQGIQTIGNQQWSGGGADSDEVTVPAGQPQGGIDDIIASFQRSAASLNYSAGAPPADGGDIAAAARQYLSKVAEALPKAEADELIREGAGSRARNLGLLRLEGTHYEDEDDELGKRGISLDDYDDDVMFA